MLPSFLIIGAMKSATTSLFRDLECNPSVFFPDDKEPNAFTDDTILTPEGLQRYAALFRRARALQVCGEASTTYTKRGEYDGVPERALRVLGGDTKLVYIVRDPVDRIVSHHHHDVAYGFATNDIDYEVRTKTRYVDVSRYMWQLRTWLECFDKSRLLVIRFEDFVAARRQVVDEVSAFLGVDPGGHLIEGNTNFNPGSDQHLPFGRWRALSRSAAYRRLLRPLIPWQMRGRLRRWLLPKAPLRSRPPSPDTIRWLTDALADDVHDLSRFLGRSEPVWPRWGPDA